MEEEKKEKIFVVSLKGVAPWISRVSYEKTEKDLKLFFTLRQGNLSTENLLLEPVEDNSILESKSEENKLLQKIKESWQYLPEPNLYFVFLNKEVFQGIGSSPRILPKIIKNLQAQIDKNVSFLVLFENSKEDVQGILWSENKELREKMLWYGEGQEKGNWLIFIAPTKNLQQTSSRLLSLLKHQR